MLKKISFPDYKKVLPSLRTRGKTGIMAEKSSYYMYAHVHLAMIWCRFAYKRFAYESLRLRVAYRLRDARAIPRTIIWLLVPSQC